MLYVNGEAVQDSCTPPCIISSPNGSSFGLKVACQHADDLIGREVCMMVHRHLSCRGDVQHVRLRACTNAGSKRAASGTEVKAEG
jgi:hypothetical protein